MTGNLFDQRLAILAFAHFIDQRGNAGDVADLVGDAGAVEIGAEADMIFAQLFDQMVEMDLTYATSRTLLLDIILILKTFRAVVSGNGAY